TSSRRDWSSVVCSADLGLARAPELLAEHQPEYVIIELGGNDGLRGLALTHIAANLTAMVRQAQEQDAVVLLLGMRLPGNYGKLRSEERRTGHESTAQVD